MPTAEAVVSWATSVANDWRWLAIFWHVAFAALPVAVSRSRVSVRLVALFLVLPIVSVAVLAWLSWNPFNGSVTHGPRMRTPRRSVLCHVRRFPFIAAIVAVREHP